MPTILPVRPKPPQLVHAEQLIPAGRISVLIEVPSMEIYATSSLHDSAYVMVRLPGRFRGITSDGKQCSILFASVNEDVEKAIREYHQGGTCSAREFAKATGLLRSRIKETIAEQNAAEPAPARRPLTPQSMTV